MIHSFRLPSIIAIGLLLFFALANYVFLGMQQIALWVVVPGVAVISYLTVPNHRLSSYLKLQITLYLWVAFTALFAFRADLATDQLVRVGGCFLMIYAISQLCKDYKLTIWLYIVYVVFYAGMVYYAWTHILTNFYDYTEDRLDDDSLNANMVAYFTLFVTFIVYVIADMVKGKYFRKVLRILFLLSPVWSLVIAFLTASRQVGIIQAPLILLLLYIRYLRIGSSTAKVIFVVSGIVVGSLLVTRGLSYYEGSVLSQRYERSIEEDSRMIHLKTAFEVGITHPIVGVGPGCYGIYARGSNTFSHNNYAELFANCGIPALLLCVILYFKFIKSQWKRYRKTKDTMFLVFFTFGLMYAVDNMFYVFYINPWLMSFFFLVAAHAENYNELYYVNVSMFENHTTPVKQCVQKAMSRNC